MAIEPFPEPFDEEGDVEQQLRDRLALLDQQREAAIAAADAVIEQAGAALPTAGNEYNSQVDAAQTALNDAIGDYQEFLDQTATNLEAAQDAIDEIGDSDAQDEINAIPSASALNVPTSGSPDCTAADVNAALADLAGDVNAIRNAIVVVLQIFQDAGSANAKEALQKLKDVGQGFRDQMPAAEDVEAEKQAKHAQIEGLYP